MKVKTGKLNQRIQIFVNNQIEDGAGGTYPNNTLYWETFCDVYVLKSSRTQEANQSPLQVIIQFTVRYRNDKNIQNDMLVLYRGNWYIVQGYDPDVVYQEYVRFDAAALNTGILVKQPV